MNLVEFTQKKNEIIPGWIIFIKMNKGFHDILKNICEDERFTGTEEERKLYCSYLENYFDPKNKTYFDFFSIKQKIVLCTVLRHTRLMFKLCDYIDNSIDFILMQKQIKKTVLEHPNDIPFITSSTLVIQYLETKIFNNNINDRISLIEQIARNNDKCGTFTLKDFILLITFSIISIFYIMYMISLKSNIKQYQNQYQELITKIQIMENHIDHESETMHKFNEFIARTKEPIDNEEKGYYSNSELNKIINQLQNRIIITEYELHNRINATVFDLQNRLNTTENDFQNRINTTEYDLQSKIETTENILQNKLNTTECQLQNIYDNIKYEIKSRIYNSITNMQINDDKSNVVDKKSGYSISYYTIILILLGIFGVFNHLKKSMQQRIEKQSKKISNVRNDLSLIKNNAQEEKRTIQKMRRYMYSVKESEWHKPIGSNLLVNFKGGIRMKGDFRAYCKYIYEIEENKKYRISFDFKKGNSEAKSVSLLLWRCLDAKQNVINECDVKELTIPTKVIRISNDRKKIYVQTPNGMKCGKDQCLAFNKAAKIDTTTQRLIRNVEITTITKKVGYYEITIDKDIPQSVVQDDFVSVHSNLNEYYGWLTKVPTDKYQTYSLYKEGYAGTTSNQCKFPICTCYCQIEIRSNVNGNINEITQYRNISLEEI